MDKLKSSTLSKNLLIILSITTLDNISLSSRERFYATSSESTIFNKFTYYSLRTYTIPMKSFIIKLKFIMIIHTLMIVLEKYFLKA